MEVDEDRSPSPEELKKSAEESPVVKLVNYILIDAVKRGATHIHLEALEEEYRVRYRIDGLLQTIMKPPFTLRDAIINRVKTMSKLDISQRRRPQEGNFMIQYMKDGKKEKVEVRVSVVPTVDGEGIVMRLLDEDTSQFSIVSLGLDPDSLAKFQIGILKHPGIVLVSGPAGSGKTTTLYSAIAELNEPGVNILTVERHVDYRLPGITQVRLNEEIGLTFASAVQCFLARDPDIIMIEDVPDSETARLSIRAARMGVQVMAGLYADDTASAISLFLNMGIEAFPTARHLSLTCAQRLVRRICQDCKVEVEVSPKLLMHAGFTPEEAETTKIYRGQGCDKCFSTGYKGRAGIFELMEITVELQQLISARASPTELKRKAEEQGMVTLRRSGLNKVATGITTLEEVLAETPL